MKGQDYFFITMHFSPDFEKRTLVRIDDDLFKHSKTGEIYKKRLMYDWGWGQECGYERQPCLSFFELVQIVSEYRKSVINYSQRRMNFVGAVSVIMQDHIEEFIDFLSTDTIPDFFANPNVRSNFKWFSFSTQLTLDSGGIPGGISTQSYEEILNQYPKWQEISSRVIELAYQ